jgi:hypothetical protein
MTATSVDVPHLRLSSQRIAGPGFGDPGEVVRWMGAMQAQDYAQALWAIGLRTRGATAADVERAIEERRIVRTWPMRGTIHFVPAEDAGWMLRLSASRMLAKDGRRLEQLGLDERAMERCAVLFSDALSGGKRLTRSAMMALLEDAGIGTTGQRGYHILWYTAQAGLICMGPMQDREQTFVLLDEWVPEPRELSREESLAELAARYFTSHGPATPHDFAWWAGLTVADAKAGITAAQPELAPVKLAGREYWTARDAPRGRADEESGVFLLPGFDEYLLGYKDRSSMLATEHASKIVPGSNGVFLPTIVVAGRIAGTWKRKLRKSAVEITLSPFAHLGDAEEGVVEAAGRYSAFLGLPLSAATGAGTRAL